MVVAKKHVRHAVQRNRVKRITREFFRCHAFTHPRDVVFLAKKNVADLSNAELRKLLSTLWRKIDAPQQQSNEG